MMARVPGQGVVASIGGPTTPGTATAEVQEQGVPSPPPGLHPLDFTNWSLPLPEARLTGGLPAPSGGPPSIRRQTVGPWAPGQWAPAPPMQAPSTPQGMLPVHQLRPRHPTTPYQQAVQPPSQPATLYQQAVQPPRRPAWRGLAAQPPSDRATPAVGQTIPDHGRPQARGWGIRGRSVSCPKRGQGMTTTVPLTTTPGAMQPQPGHRSRPGRSDLAMLASKYHSSRWRRDLEHVLKVYYKHSVKPLPGSRSGRESGNSSLTASSQRRPKCWLSKKSPLWNTCPSLPRSSIGLQASICMTSRNSLCGLRRGVISMGYWSSEAKSRSAPI